MEIGPSRKAVLYLLFAVSGFCALVYELLWTKYLSLTFGTTMPAVSVVAATFMGGLALGSFLLGRYADREVNLLRLYALLEAGIAVFALLFPPTVNILTDIHVFFERLAPTHPVIVHAIHFCFAAVLLLPPTICMGGTFPLMCRFFARKKSGGQIGRLYALNTLGATLGAFLAGYSLIPALGLSRTGYLAVALNLAVAAASLLLARNVGHSAVKDVSQATRPEQPLQASRHRLLLLGIGLVGFFSLAYEILWTRVLLPFLGNTTYAFALILSAFLVGIALGGALYARLVHPGLNEKKVFTQLSVLMGFSILATSPLYDQLAHLFQAAHLTSGENWWLLALLSFLIVFAVVGVPTILSGSLLPAAVAILDPGRTHTGRGVGLVVLANTAGAMLGSLAGGFLLVPLFGIQNSFRLLGCLNLGLGLLFFLAHRQKIRLSPAFHLVPAMGLALTLVPGSWDAKLMNSGVYCYAPMYAKYGMERSLAQETILAVIEGRETTVAIKETATPEKIRYFTVNGKTDGGTGRDMETQLLVGQIPLLLHPDPQKALVIGLGSGITLGGVKEHPLAQLDCVEISPEVVQASEFFRKENRNALADPKVRLIVEDGRDLLLVSEGRYDVIVSQPSNPWQSGNANLFTLDFYQLAASRLAEGGLFSQWIGLYDTTPENLRIAVNTFLQAFPHTLTFRVNADLVMVGSNRLLQFDYRRIAGKMAAPRVREVLSAAGVSSPGDLLARHYYLSDAALRSFAADARINEDDRPALEFSFRDNLGGKMFGLLKNENLAALGKVAVNQPVPLVNLGGTPDELTSALRELHTSYQGVGRYREARYFSEKLADHLKPMPAATPVDEKLGG